MPVDVGEEVGEVGVRVAVLLARDLRGRDLVQQAVGAVGELVGLVGERAGLGLERLDVGEQLVGDRRHAGGRVLLPQRLLDAVEAGPLLALLDVVDAGVDVRVEGAEALRDRLDRLVGTRAAANCALASSTSPALTAATKACTRATSSTACVWT